MLKAIPVLAALAISTALVVPTVSQAAEHASVRVSYADLNLATLVGQNKLQRRVVFAARSVCDNTDQLDLKLARAIAECRDGAVADVQPAIQAAIGRARHPSVEVLDGAALIVTAR